MGTRQKMARSGLYPSTAVMYEQKWQKKDNEVYSPPSTDHCPIIYARDLSKILLGGLRLAILLPPPPTNSTNSVWLTESSLSDRNCSLLLLSTTRNLSHPFSTSTFYTSTPKARHHQHHPNKRPWSLCPPQPPRCWSALLLSQRIILATMPVCYLRSSLRISTPTMTVVFSVSRDILSTYLKPKGRA